jgi:hypothetical protein
MKLKNKNFFRVDDEPFLSSLKNIIFGGDSVFAKNNA